MPYFLDGNNLIGRLRRTSRATEEDRAALVAEVLERLRLTRARAVLFFDGPGYRKTSLGNLSVREVAGSTADDAIVSEVERAHAPQEITVVTADRELARRVRDAGAKSLRPEQFWQRFGTLKPRPSREEAAPVNVQEWMRYFEDEKNREK